MPRFIVTGNYTGAAIKGMIAKPSDREAASRALAEAGGGKLESFYMTTGATDFVMIISADDAATVISGTMVAAAAGIVSNIQTQRAFTSAEFMEMQKTAGKYAAAYKAPG